MGFFSEILNGISQSRRREINFKETTGVHEVYLLRLWDISTYLN